MVPRDEDHSSSGGHGVTKNDATWVPPTATAQVLQSFQPVGQLAYGFLIRPSNGTEL